MKIIGITGGSGTGKTTALEAISDLGGVVIDCDKVYHELLLSSESMKKALFARFPEIETGDAIDRKKLANIVFSNPSALEELGQITHPFILEETKRRLKDAEEQGIALAAIDAAALIESRFSELCDIVVGILAPEECRLGRIILRDALSREEALRRISAQQDQQFYIDHCDTIIINDKNSMEEFLAYCREYFQKIAKGS